MIVFQWLNIRSPNSRQLAELLPYFTASKMGWGLWGPNVGRLSVMAQTEFKKQNRIARKRLRIADIALESGK